MTETAGATCPIPTAAPDRAPRRRAHAVELSLIALTLLGAWLATADVSWSLELRWVFGYAAIVILAQGFVRDVAKLALRRDEPEATQSLGPCLCAESSLGLVLGIAGAGGLTLLGVTQSVALDQTRITTLLAALLAVGFLAKDYVLVLKRVEDHAAIKVW